MIWHASRNLNVIKDKRITYKLVWLREACDALSRLSCTPCRPQSYRLTSWLAYWNTYAVTGYRDIGLLVASHIKPWRASSNAERLDKFNGLLLIPNLDRSFDAGLVTFEKDGVIRISPQLSEPAKLGISSGLRVALTPENEIYMEFHRVEVYRDG